jgi:hypothetical protein
LRRSCNGIADRTTRTVGGLHVRFELVGEIRDIQTFTIGGSIRECRRLARRFGEGR